MTAATAEELLAEEPHTENLLSNVVRNFLAIFQSPNKLYEKDGRVIDSSGKDSDAVRGVLLPK